MIRVNRFGLALRSQRAVLIILDQDTQTEMRKEEWREEGRKEGRKGKEREREREIKKERD